MRQLILAILAASLLLQGCSGDPKVMARPVPERADDFAFENDLIAGRFYGKALEGNPTSPGLDIWVKLPGRLVANEWYAAATSGDGSYYHRDHGGKDCYKVAVSLGGGASVPFIGGVLCYPATNYRSSEILEYTPRKVTFVLHYPEWEAAEGVMVSLDKKFTLQAGSYFAEVEDTYNFTGKDAIDIATGITIHGNMETSVGSFDKADRIALWEDASDQGTEPEDGKIGVAVVLPGAEYSLMSAVLDHALLVKKIKSGETISYKVGSCWSKGNVKTPEKWVKLVEKQ